MLSSVPNEPAFQLAHVDIRYEGFIKPQDLIQLDEDTALNDHLFYHRVKALGEFLVSKGRVVQIQLDQDFDQGLLQIYLQGSITAAILHQRGQFIFHGSSFIYKNKGIILCGDSEVGKSSLTATFCSEGSEFLTDDITPIQQAETGFEILARGQHIKLWKDSLFQLGYENERLHPIYTQEEKYFLHVKPSRHNTSPIHVIVILEASKAKHLSHRVLTGIEKFKALRPHVFREAYLKGMPELEKAYLPFLSDLCQQVTIVNLQRPLKSKITKTKDYLEKVLENPYF